MGRTVKTSGKGGYVLLCLLFIMGLLGCALLPREEEELPVRVPAFPSAWLGRERADDYELLFLRDGAIERRIIRFPAAPRGDPGFPLTFTLGKRTPLALYPRIRLDPAGKGGEGPSLVTLLPAGGLYPDFLEGGTVPLLWEDGFAAETLLLIAREGFPLDSFNCARFFQEARKRGAPDPWDLNRSKALETLASGTFRADRLTQKKRFILSLNLPPGEWHGESLLRPPLRAEEDALNVELSWGVWRFWSVSHSITIHVTEQGRSQSVLYDR